MQRQGRHGRAPIWSTGRVALVAVLVLGVLTACQNGGVSAGGSSTSGSVTQTAEPLKPAGIAVNVAADAVDVRPDTPVTVAATGGTLSAADRKSVV